MATRMDKSKTRLRMCNPKRHKRPERHKTRWRKGAPLAAYHSVVVTFHRAPTVWLDFRHSRALSGFRIGLSLVKDRHAPNRTSILPVHRLRLRESSEPGTPSNLAGQDQCDSWRVGLTQYRGYRKARILGMVDSRTVPTLHRSLRSLDLSPVSALLQTVPFPLHPGP